LQGGSDLINSTLMNPDFAQYEGKTFNEKLVNEIYAYIKEERIKSNLNHHNYLPASLVTSLKDDEIKKIGCSIPNDIINDNLGELLAAIFRPVSTGTKTVTTFEDTNPTTRSLIIYSSTVGELYTSGAGGALTRVQLGQGSTAPTRTDFNIETPFANGGPEDGKNKTDDGSFLPSSNQVQVGKLIGPMAGGGTITETCLFGVWNATVGGLAEFLASRDLVGSIPFLIGEFVSVRYFWSF